MQRYIERYTINNMLEYHWMHHNSISVTLTAYHLYYYNLQCNIAISADAVCNQFVLQCIIQSVYTIDTIHILMISTPFWLINQCCANEYNYRQVVNSVHLFSELMHRSSIQYVYIIYNVYVVNVLLRTICYGCWPRWVPLISSLHQYLSWLQMDYPLQLVSA